PEAFSRPLAAVSAFLAAGEGGGKGLRDKGLVWLRQEVERARRLLVSGRAEDIVNARQLLAGLVDGYRLRPLRGRATLARLPEDERRGFEQFWDEVRKLQRAAQALAGP